MDITNLGTYASIDALWQAHPEGGKEGDYCTIGSVKHRWNKYDCIWENSETVTSSDAHKIESADDLHVQNDLVVGGKIKGDISLVDLKEGPEIKEQAKAAKESAEEAKQYASGVSEALQEIVGMGDLPEGTAALAANTAGVVSQLSKKFQDKIEIQTKTAQVTAAYENIKFTQNIVKDKSYNININNPNQVKFSIRLIKANGDYKNLVMPTEHQDGNTTSCSSASLDLDFVADDNYTQLWVVNFVVTTNPSSMSATLSEVNADSVYSKIASLDEVVNELDERVDNIEEDFGNIDVAQIARIPTIYKEVFGEQANVRTTSYDVTSGTAINNANSAIYLNSDNSKITKGTKVKIKLDIPTGLLSKNMIDLYVQNGSTKLYVDKKEEIGQRTQDYGIPCNSGTEYEITCSESDIDRITLYKPSTNVLASGTITITISQGEKVNSLKEDIQAINTTFEGIANGGYANLKEKVNIYNCGMTTKGNMSSIADKLSLPRTAIKFGFGIGFVGTIGTWNSNSKLIIGYGDSTNYQGYWFEIDSTNVKLYKHMTENSLVETKVHGLAFANNIQVNFEHKQDNSKKITITSNGVEYSVESLFVGQGQVYAYVENATLNDCTLGFFADCAKYDTWLFGDSYLGTTNDERWCYYLMRDGHNKLLIDAYPGENSATSIVDLQNLLELAIPKRIIWTLGMNDNDGTGTSVNTSWKTCYNTLVGLCNKYGIELILATIPCAVGGYSEDDTSGNGGAFRNNKYKNAFIKASNYRYIDFAKAVGASEEDGTWYNDGLTNDMLEDSVSNGVHTRVHPTAKGALVLYHQAIVDCPELITFI